ncbi:TetR/AcrR family transcriptional regulator [Nocardia cyriacigeorgica]|uniref:TetR/AcrR family transcriptional regulator n=1 Tax=Nocardia cyriacigeorgica TaxID=135487 RepID=UPI0024537C5A|nr:helix-turn-helix domain-containing protein [Nocardia cyriacigeorgica]
MTGQLIEHDSIKAARILDSARELALRHGVRKVTIAEIAKSAGVGKGTVYLYWETKEDLFMGLITREVLAWIDTINAQIAQDPHTILPRNLAPLLIRTTLGNPWLRWVRNDDSALRQLVHRPADQQRFIDASPSAMANVVTTTLRAHGIVRDDLPEPQQRYAIHALLVGFSTVMADPPSSGPIEIDDPETVLAEVVHLLLEPPTYPADGVIAAAAETVRARFTEIRDGLLSLITTGAAGTR